MVLYAPLSCAGSVHIHTAHFTRVGSPRLTVGDLRESGQSVRVPSALAPSTSLASSRAISDLRRKEVFPVSPSEAEVEAKKRSFRGLGPKELQRRLNDNQIGRFGSWEHRVAQSVLGDIAREKEARRPKGGGSRTALGVFVLLALTLALKLLGVI